MIEIIINFLKDALGYVISFAILILNFLFEIASWLHAEAPVLVGLIVGVSLAWIMTRRDRHPILRVLSSPIKLVIDILDLAWDQAVEVIDDVVETVMGLLRKSLGLVTGNIKRLWNLLIESLISVKNNLKNSKDD